MHWLLLVALAMASPEGEPTPQAEAERAWAVGTSRVLGAAGTVRDRAWRLAETARAVSGTGRVGGMSALSADARELDRAVVSALLAAEVLVAAAPQPPAPLDAPAP